MAGIRLWTILALTMFATATPARAQEPRALTFDAAETRFDRLSHTISAADHGVDAARAAADATKALHRPIVTASAQYIAYQKTLSVDLTGPKADALGGAQGALAGFADSVPPAFQDIAAQIAGRLSQALPSLFGAIPDTLSYRYRDTVFRPTVQAALPIYTGGAIPAIQRAAQGGVAVAEARRAQAGDVARLDLIRAYFGQQAARGLYESARRSRDAFDRILADTRKLEAAGALPHARVLEVQVARDAAARACVRAELGAATARDELARLLDIEGAVATATPLFVDTRPLPPKTSFGGGEASAPESRLADASRGIADAGVDLARSRRRPQVYGFGEYNLNRNDALPVEPDWIVGVGVRYTILSNLDRRRTEDAARAQAAAAADGAAEARRVAISATARAHDLAEGARRSFLLLDSSLAAARENLRVQDVSYREGEATATTLLAAQAALDTAEAQRIATAYEYDLSLAGLLASAGRLGEFSGRIAAADTRLTYGSDR